MRYLGDVRVRWLQGGLVVLPAVEHADDGYPLNAHIEGDYRTSFVIRDAQTGTDVIAAGTPLRKSLQSLAIRDDGVGVAFGNIW